MLYEYDRRTKTASLSPSMKFKGALQEFCQEFLEAILKEMKSNSALQIDEDRAKGNLIFIKLKSGFQFSMKIDSRRGSFFLELANGLGMVEDYGLLGGWNIGEASPSEAAELVAKSLKSLRKSPFV